MSAITVYVLVIVLTCVLTAVIAQTNGDVRLVGSGNPRSGTLEVWYNGRYGGVCNDFFQSNAAKVVCRQLGFPTSSPVYSSERGQSAFYLDDVKCNGNEARISDCRHGQWGTSDCSDVEHINVTCSADPCRNDLCLNGGRCIQVLDANYRCNCPPGYHGSKCENETNECLTNNGGCSHVCVNTVGSYYCQCPDVELELGHDNHTCYAEGLNVVCTSDTMEVTFDKRYFRGMHGQYLTLRDTTCAAVDMPTQVKVTVPLEGCGTRFQQVGNAFVYENQVLSHTVPIQGLVTRVRDVNITVRCFYSINNTVDNFYYVDTGELHFTDHNQGTYQISMDLIHNGNVYHPTNSLPLSVEPGEKLSVKLSLQTNDSHLQVFARNCKATPTHTDQNTQQYLVLDNGCSTDPSLTMKNISDVSEEILSLETFKFLDNSSTLYFHCEVLVCNVSDPDSRCQQGCLRPGMGKRDAEMEDRDDDIYLSSHSLTVGPMEVNDKTQLATRTKKSDLGESEHHDPETNRATLAAGLALLGVVLIMVTVALSIIFKGDEEDKEIEKGDDMEKLLSNDE